MIPPNPEPRQRLLSLSICASQSTGLGYAGVANVGSDACATLPWEGPGSWRSRGGHRVRPWTHSGPQSLTPGILLKRFKT